jgi:hypothetical protein
MFGSTALGGGTDGAVGADDKKFGWVAVLSDQFDQQLVGFGIADRESNLDRRAIGAVVA